jgi:uncharacterized protein
MLSSKIFKKISKIFLYTFLIFNILMASHAYHTSYSYNQGEYPFKKAEEKTKTENITAALFGAKLSKRTMHTAPSFPYETLRLKDDEDFMLEAWHVPSDSARGTILLLHGHGSCKAALVNEANYFHQLGYNTFSLDVRSHGNSEGNVNTVGYKEINNVKLAYDWIAAKGEQNIILFGSSMGAAMTLKAVAELDIKPKKIIINCPFATMQEATEGFLRKFGLPTFMGHFLMFWASVERGVWTYNYKPVEYAKQVKMPVLMQWGRMDERVAVSETNAIFQNIPSTDKELVIYENCKHESYYKETEKWKATVQAFLAK